MNIKLQKGPPALLATPTFLTLWDLQGVDSSKGEEGRTDKLLSGCKPPVAKPGTCRRAPAWNALCQDRHHCQGNGRGHLCGEDKPHFKL